MMNLDFDEYPITEDEVIAVLGPNFQRRGKELVWQCPACPGGDTKHDNLKFNIEKNIIKCFACDFGETVTRIIAKRRWEKQQGKQSQDKYEFERAEAPIAPLKVTPKEIKPEDLMQYYWECHCNLMRNKDVLEAMYHKHTIMPKTAAMCWIGYDSKKDKLVFPTFLTGADPTNINMIEAWGAEYREYQGEKHIRRIDGYNDKAGIVRVDITNHQLVKYAVICEGYKDAYNAIQLFSIARGYLQHPNYTAFFTVKNGVNTINDQNCLQKINWKLFERVDLIMDNDEAGDLATQTAQNLFPFMKDGRTILNQFNDIQQYFAKTITSQIDIEKMLNADWIKEY